jgi:hypothetical protein
MGGYFYARTPLNGANFKTRAIVRKVVWSAFVDQGDGDQELGIAGVSIVDITNVREIGLIPVVGAIALDGIVVVEVFDTIAKGIGSAGELPGEDARGVAWFRNHTPVAACRSWRPVRAD